MCVCAYVRVCVYVCACACAALNINNHVVAQVMKHHMKQLTLIITIYVHGPWFFLCRFLRESGRLLARVV